MNKVVLPKFQAHHEIAPLGLLTLIIHPNSTSSFSSSLNIPSEMRLLLPRPLTHSLLPPIHRSFKPSLVIRSFSTCKMSTISAEPVFSSSYDPQQGSKDLEPLLRAQGGKWSLIESGKGVERSFKFKTFKKTWVCVLVV